ncbi:MAG: metal ABC transporter ATP-binding protein [Halothiobacillus sp.]
MHEPIIEIRNLAFGYDSVPALIEVNLCVARGEFIAVIGPNGGGKTTLMRLILGLLEPQRGQVHVFGEPPGNNAARIGYVPQHSNTTQGFPASAEQVVLMGLAQGKRHGFRFTQAEREAAEHAMQRAGVLDLRHRRLNELSGGQRQRILIARALITQPELLILDEPLSNIDPYGRQCILETLTGLNSNTTVVMVSHDLGITANAVTGIIAVNQFAIAAPGTKLTPAMLELMYGTHEAGCPVHALLQQLVDSSDVDSTSVESNKANPTAQECHHEPH